MTRTVWLASYPKSGNTWLRLLTNVSTAGDEPVDINKLPARRIASDRGDFDSVVLIDSSLLMHDEIDCLRPRAYEAIARGSEDGSTRHDVGPVRFVKAHDAYTMNPAGEPLLGGSQGADGAIVVVRDPRDVVSSLAHHNNFSIDDAIAFMNDENAAICKKTSALDVQLRQKLRSWSGHAASWLDQTDLPVHLIRYEDLHSDAAGALRRALAFAGLPATDEQINRAVARCNFALLRQREQQNGFAEAPRLGVEFFRRGEAGSWRNELTRDQVIRIEQCHADDAATWLRVMLRIAASARRLREDSIRLREDSIMIRRQGEWLSAKVGDELVMMSVDRGDYLGLTEVGARIWELIEVPREIEELCGKLQEEFDVSAETCRIDVEAFLNELVKHDAISIDPPAAA